MPRMDVTEIPFAKFYPLLVAKAEKKNRSREEVDQVTTWLTGYTPEEPAQLKQSDVSCGDFFRNAPATNLKLDYRQNLRRSSQRQHRHRVV